ncbi:hypothetical protein A2U01_0112672, partial [Trifolium medium]|nr:hypothetical protein [Trifolium medium]
SREHKEQENFNDGHFVRKGQNLFFEDDISVQLMVQVVAPAQTPA